jgi:hypothetical protein
MQEHLFNGGYFGSNNISGISASNFLNVPQAFGVRSKKLSAIFQLVRKHKEGNNWYLIKKRVRVL